MLRNSLPYLPSPCLSIPSRLKPPIPSPTIPSITFDWPPNHTITPYPPKYSKRNSSNPHLHPNNQNIPPSLPIPESIPPPQNIQPKTTESCFPLKERNYCNATSSAAAPQVPSLVYLVTGVPPMTDWLDVRP